MEDSPLQYRKPPVQEAIFSVAFQEALPLESIRAFSKTAWVVEHYPHTAEPEAEDILSGSSFHRLGLSMRSANANSLLRFTTTQFSFHAVKKYPGWDVASAAFLAAWHHAERHCQLPAIRYMSIRYINRLVLGTVPEAGLKVTDYLHLAPDLPDDFPGSPGRFFLQVESFEPTQQLEGLVWETLIPAKREDEPLQALLDINVRSTPDQQPAPEMSEFLRKGRIFKNKLFESCITPATRTLFN